MPHGHIDAQDLGLLPASGKEAEVFKWFLAAYLFGKPIQQEVAERTWHVFMKHGLTSPQKLYATSWQRLVEILDEGHYVRYDESMARNLRTTAKQLLDNYGGKLTHMRDQAANRHDFETRLQELPGVGPKTTEIFMREMKKIWH